MDEALEQQVVAGLRSALGRPLRHVVYCFASQALAGVWEAGASRLHFEGSLELRFAGTKPLRVLAEGLDKAGLVGPRVLVDDADVAVGPAAWQADDTPQWRPHLGQILTGAHVSGFRHAAKGAGDLAVHDVRLEFGKGRVQISSFQEHEGADRLAIFGNDDLQDADYAYLQGLWDDLWPGDREAERDMLRLVLRGLAESTLGGAVDLIDGCRSLAKRWRAADLADSDAVRVILDFVQEAEHFQHGANRRPWHEDYLERADREETDFLKVRRERVLAACRDIVGQLSSPESP